MVRQDERTVAIRGILMRLCKRSGLSSDRLRTTEIDVSPLLDLLIVQQYAHRSRVSPEEAVLPVVRDMARQLDPTDRLIVDAALSLGLLREKPPTGMDLDRFYASDLGERREYLTEHWYSLHEALWTDRIPPAPTVRSLRAAPERRAFTALAENLAAGSALPSGVIHGGMPTSKPLVLLPNSQQRPGVITVIGDAVIDHTYRVDHMPGPGVSARGRFEESLGGKGLNRAIAAARLGLEVRFITAVGDDAAGRRIVQFLRRENVGTELVKVVPYATTPVAAVIITASGMACTIGREEDDEVKLNQEDLRRPEVQTAITVSDAVLLTFEPPPMVIERVMAMIRAAPDRPKLLVQPTPKVNTPQYIYEYLRITDYLIGTRRELGELVPDIYRSSGPDDRAVEPDFDGVIAPRLRALGVHNVCAVEGFECRVRSATVNLDIPRPPAAMLEDSAGARAAFAAALAYRVVTNHRQADQDDFEWATAAASTTQSFRDVAAAMPRASEVDRIMQLPPNGTATGSP